MTVNPARIRTLNNRPFGKGPVVYWMSRDQRVTDNWALLAAREVAAERQVPVVILFCLLPSYPGAAVRAYDFMMKGLREVETEAHRENLGFRIVPGDPAAVIPGFVQSVDASSVICDFSPLRTPRNWKSSVAESLKVPLIEVDAHNIVPCWHASDKQEYSARTIRPKLLNRLSEFLVPFPLTKPHPYAYVYHEDPLNWDFLAGTIKADDHPGSIEGLKPGPEGAKEVLGSFVDSRLEHYASSKNNPLAGSLSGLSPYLHFGQISAQRVALEVSKIGGENAQVFLEELIVRRELAENFCFYNDRYDAFDGFPKWAQSTLLMHWDDQRPLICSKEDFEKAGTPDPLWNAAQAEMITTGKMHGYMRMYWAKKILEWSINPEEAINIAIYLNDKYSLDGRDPNGYVGIAWSIGGLHDRPWFPRPVFGTIRYMSFGGCKKKFDVNRYIRQFGFI